MKNFNVIFDEFVDRIAELINKHAPLKRLSRRQLKLARKPWIAKGILTSIRYKNAIFRSHFIDGNLNKNNIFDGTQKSQQNTKLFIKNYIFMVSFKKAKRIRS